MNAKLVASGRIEGMHVSSFGFSETFGVGRDSLSVVMPDYASEPNGYAYTGLLDRVVVTLQ